MTGGFLTCEISVIEHVRTCRIRKESDINVDEDVKQQVPMNKCDIEWTWKSAKHD